MKKLDNLSLVKNRIVKVAKIPPNSPLKGRGYNRVEIQYPKVFTLLQKLAPNHCEIVTNRETLNRYGSLGFIGHPYVSPELFAVIVANADDFRSLESSLNLVEKFNL